MVHEYVTWFSSLGEGGPQTPVEVVRRSGGAVLPALQKPFRIVSLTRPPRLELWSAALVLWRDRPLLGVGPDNFRHLYGPRLGLTDFDDRIQASSFYVETIANLGLFGAVALIGMLATLVGTLWRGWGTTFEPARRVLALGTIVALSAFFLHGLVDYFHAFTPTYGLFWLLMGLALCLLGREIRR